MNDDRPSTLVMVLAFFAAAMMVVLVAAGCAGWRTQLKDRVVECGTRQATGAIDLGVQVIRALQGAGWDAALQKLVDESGELAVCVIAKLPSLPTTARLPAGMTSLSPLLRQRAASWLASRGIRVR